MKYLIAHRLTLIGIVMGAIGGFLYWNYIGCANGMCLITSKPINSTLYGGLMGGLFFSIFQNNNKNEQ
jgi:phage shock protein E